jgi:eukaryotic-like serine/threonine-protein kinase
MSLTAGARLGPYEILSLLGRGGMGEVYRAKDTRLRRDVAIKVFPPSFAPDPDRVQRFEREAQVLAALNHAHIGAIYGLEEAGESYGLVLELVEGPTLEDRLKAGAIPMREVLRIALQVADALEAAHERGIVHRDLKPANIKLTPGGEVKVLDFGLAKPVLSHGASGSGFDDLSRSPTITIGPTGHGTLLGTAPYMSPEQARGLPVDKPADIWAFGCLLYELLTGQRTFSGPTITDAIAAILEREPVWAALPADTPSSVRRVLERCLQKDQKRRLRDIGEARVEIEDALTSPTKTATVEQKSRPSISGGALGWVASMALGAVAAGILVWDLKPRTSATPLAPEMVARLTIMPAEPLVILEGAAIALSPDGRRLAYVGGTDRRRRLYVRDLDQFESKLIPGGEDADNPFFSPDGQWLGFVVDRKLKKVGVQGGASVTVADPSEWYGVAWAADDTIVYNPTTGAGVWRVPAAGGKPSVVTELGENEGRHRFPALFNDGKTLLFSAPTPSGEERIYVQSIETKQRRTLAPGIGARYLPTGHLVYVQNGTMLAAPFDPVRLEMTTTPVTVLEGVGQAPSGAPQVTFSQTGSLAYIPAGVTGLETMLVWVDAMGGERPLRTSDRIFWHPRLSPDGRRVAAASRGASEDLWTYDLARETWSRLTFDGSSSFPLWSPDGRRLTFQSSKGGSSDIYWKALDGNAAEERLVVGDRPSYPLSWSPDTRALAFVFNDPFTRQDIWAFMPEDKGKPRPFLQTTFREGAPVFSPDGRWLAYVSDESGRNEIYVRPFPGPGEKWTISSEGGNEPIWPSGSKQLFYRGPDAMMAVDVTTSPTFSAGSPRRVFDDKYDRSNAFWPNYDVTSDGKRFLMVKTSSRTPAPAQISVVLNWFEELKRRVPVGRN